MHRVRTTSIAAPLLLLGMIFPAYAQRGQREEKPAQAQQQHAAPQRAAPQQHALEQQQQPRAQVQQQRPQQQRQVQKARQARSQQQQRAQAPQQRPQQRVQQAQQQRSQPQQRAQQTRQQQQPQRSRQQAASWQQQRGWAQHGAWQGHNSWQQGRSQDWGRDHRDWGQRGGYGGFYIPQASFNLSFGNRHWFRMGGLPSMYMGYPRFAYGGFSFMILDPWPGAWAENWYATDDVYVDYDNGYYLHNRRYPGVGLAISVAL